MAQKYIPFMEVIKRCQQMKDALPCIEFNYSINPYLGYWYAEERLYILHDCMMDAYYFETAGNPHEAIEKVNKRWDEAMHAGEMVVNDYE